LSEKSPSRLNEAASAAVKYEHAMNKGINEARKIKYKCIQSKLYMSASRPIRLLH
jgi:hypothetical protein